MTFKAMRLDERDVLVAIEELPDDAQLALNQVDLRPYGGECDRSIGEYRWNREKQTLEPLPRHQRAQAGRPTMEQAYAFDLLQRWDARRRDGKGLTPNDVALAWLDDFLRSFDAVGLASLPLVKEYAADRGLDLKKKA